MAETIISNKEAYDIYKLEDWNSSDSVRQIIEVNSLSDDLFKTLRWKIRNIRKSREISRKQLEVVTNMHKGTMFFENG